MTGPIALVRDVEVTQPTEPIGPAPDGTRPAERVWLLVRVFSQPLGFVRLDLPATGLRAETIDAAIEDAFGDRVRALRERSDFLATREEILRAAPPITVVVCTRERPRPLRRCLDSLLAQEYPGYRVLVVDNAPETERTHAVVARVARRATRSRGREVSVDYLRVEEPGLSIARNRAVEHVPGEILAWIDDDEVADCHWLAEVARALAEHPRADVVGGVVIPAELETQAQVWFEQFGGHSKGRGFTPAVFSPATRREQSPLYPLPPFATGANMVFRPGVIERIGGFDHALGAGTPAMGSEDTLAFTQVLLGGGTIVYQPTAITRHYHRRDVEGLHRQMVGYGTGLTAAYTSLILRRPTVVPRLLALVPRALRTLRAADSARVATVEDDFPRELLRANQRAMLRGPTAYLRGLARGHARTSLGWAPEVLILSCLGVLMVAYAYAAGRLGLPVKDQAYWAGQVMVFVPPVARLLSLTRPGARTSPAARGEPLPLVVGLTINQYLLKVFYSPDQFRFPDELQHWAATTTLVDSGRLFVPTPALPVAVSFPGLEELGACLVSLTGLSVTSAGLLVAGVAHLAFVGVVYLTISAASHDPALAAVACALYSTAGHYLFFDSMYLYQTAALPFLALTLWAFGRTRWGNRPRWSYAALGLLAVLVVTVSHHITALVTVACLLLAGACQMVRGQPGWRWLAPLPGVVASAVVVGWFLIVSTDLKPYLTAPAEQLAGALRDILRGSSGATAPLPDSPGWETAIQATGLLVLIGFLVRAAQLLVSQRGWPLGHQLVLLGSCAYFCGVVLRFAGSQGPELAGRASTFTYLPVSLLVAGSLVGWSRRPAARRTQVGAIVLGTLLATLLLLAGRAGGWPPHWARLPGEYLVSAFERSVDPEGTAAAWWTREHVPAGSRVAADTTGLTLVSTYGGQDPVREAGSLYLVSEWSDQDARLVRSLAIDLIWVDTRLADQVPQSGEYFPQDPLADRHTSPLDRAALVKLDTVERVSRVYDSGAIHLYDVRSL